MEYQVLNNGVKIPMLGIGTFLLEPAEAERAVSHALQVGYRLIDTANAYLNERAVGRAIRDAGIDRKDIFLETKIWPSFYEQKDAVDRTLDRLGTEYVDLMLLHQPGGNYIAGYRLLEKAYRDGKVRSIGLSNFTLPQIEEILSICEVKPTVLQCEAHPYGQQKQAKKFLFQQEIALQAWYPLGHGDKALLNEAVFTELAEKYEKSVAQMILKWHIQVGNIIIPGSKNPEHITSNYALFDFDLTKEEMNRISQLNKEKYYHARSEEDWARYAAFTPDVDGEIY